MLGLPFGGTTRAGLVGVMDDCVRDAANQHGAHTAKTARPHDNHRGLMTVGHFDDRLPHWARGFDCDDLGGQSCGARHLSALRGDPAAIIGGHVVYVGEANRGCASPRKAAHAGEWLPDGQDQRLLAREQAPGELNRVLGTGRAQHGERRSNGDPGAANAGGVSPHARELARPKGLQTSESPPTMSSPPGGARCALKSLAHAPRLALFSVRSCPSARDHVARLRRSPLPARRLAHPASSS
jgi:hypothetical protein